MPISLVEKISASKLLHYFSSHPAAFGFRAFSPLENISLNTANKKMDQILSDFKTDSGADGNAISHNRPVVVILLSLYWVLM